METREKVRYEARTRTKFKSIIYLKRSSNTDINMKLDRDLHRTIFPQRHSKAKRDLSKVRILETGKTRDRPQFDVHYHTDFTVKPCGKDNKYGGLSFWSSHFDEHEYVEDPQKWNEFHSSIKKNDKRGNEQEIPRFFCYKLPKETDLPS